jgi:hypothetical protein
LRWRETLPRVKSIHFDLDTGQFLNLPPVLFHCDEPVPAGNAKFNDAYFLDAQAPGKRAAMENPISIVRVA